MNNDNSYEDLIRQAIGHLNLRSYGDLAEVCRKAASINGTRCEAYFMLSIASYLLDDLGRAVELAEKGHELSPDCNEINDLLAHLHAHTGNPKQSVYYAKLVNVGDSNPLLADVQVAGLDNLSKALQETKEASYKVDAVKAYYKENYQEAIQLFEKELRLRNGDDDFFRKFGVSLCRIGEIRRGIAALHGAVHMNPENGEGYQYLGDGYLQLGDRGMARTCYDRAIQLSDGDIGVITSISHSLGVTEGKWPSFDEAVKKWRSINETEEVSASTIGGTSDRESLRVGYLLDRAAQCDALRLIEPVLWNFDRNTIDYYVYSTNRPEDLTADRLKSLVSFWMDIRDANDQTVVQTIKQHDLDILIDMTFTPEGQRYNVLAARPAPRIYRWPGLMHDSFAFLYDGCLPENISPKKSRKMEDVVLDAEHMPAVEGESPVQSQKMLTFGSTADLSRITPDVVMVWADILRKVPDSQLLLGNNYNISSAAEDKFMDMFATAGVVDRVKFIQMEKNLEEGLIVSRLKFMVGLDVYLDPFPVTGFVEVADALWAGVPVISMQHSKSDTMAMAMIRAAGYSGWIAKNRNAYIDAAVSTADKVKDEPDWRSDMHAAVKESALFQTQSWKDKHSTLLAAIVGKS